MSLQHPQKNKGFQKIKAWCFIAFLTPLFTLGWGMYDRFTTKKRFQKEIKPWFQINDNRQFTFLLFLLSIFSIWLSTLLFQMMWPLLEMLHQLCVLIPQGAWTGIHGVSWPSLFSISTLIRNWRGILLLNLFIFFLLSKPFYKFYRKQRNLNGKEKGDDRLLQEKELKKTFPKIPNRGLVFEGYGGIPVAHQRYITTLPSIALRAKMTCHFPRSEPKIKKSEKVINKNKHWGIQALTWYGKQLSKEEQVLQMNQKPSGDYYIMTEAINSLIVGMTRSGKGETVVNPLVDILSRAKKQSSMVIGDPKGELFQMSYDTLKQRGYNVQVLNFQDIDFSMSYNPLQRAIEFAKKGYYEQVQTEVETVAEAFYRSFGNRPDGNSKFWEDSSINLFSALIMANIWRAKMTEEWETLTLRNMVSMLNQLGSEEVLVDAQGQEVGDPTEAIQKISKITLYFNELKAINQQPETSSQFLTMADDSFRQSNFAGEEAKGNIFSSMISGVKNFLNDSIARLTSKNQLDLTTVGFPRQLLIHFREVQRFSNTTLILQMQSATHPLLLPPTKVIVDRLGYLHFSTVPLLSEAFTVIIHACESDESFKIEAKLGASGVEMINSDEQIDQVEMKYSEQPTAVFLVIPPHRKAFNGMVSLFIDQMFNANYELALNAPGRTCTHRIHYVLDEFGNLPAIPAMDTKLSIGLSSNQLFSLFVQNLEQIEATYGKQTAQTILSNCTINEYIKSVSDDTMRKFEELSGKKTVIARSKTIDEKGQTTYNFNTVEQAVLSKGQLQKLQSGEAFISVGVKAETQWGQKTSNYPLLVSGKFEFPSRYMFLFDEFNPQKRLADIPVFSAHRQLELRTISLDWSENFEGLKAYRKQPIMEAAGIKETLSRGRFEPAEKRS